MVLFDFLLSYSFPPFNQELFLFLRYLNNPLSQLFHHFLSQHLLIPHLFPLHKPSFKHLLFLQQRIIHNPINSLIFLPRNRSKYLRLFKKRPHRPLEIDLCVKIKHHSHPLDFWINLYLFDSDLVEQSIEKGGFVDVRIEDESV